MGRFTRRSAWLSAMASLAAVAVTAACRDRAVESNRDHEPPVVTSGPRGRVVHNLGARERWVPRAGVPRRPLFLFSGVLAVARARNGEQAVLPPAGDRLLIFDREGRFVRDGGFAGLVRAIGVTRLGERWLVVERDGRVLDRESLPFVARAFPTPATITAFGNRLVAARSPFAVTLATEPAGAPLLVELAPSGLPSAAIDTIVRTPNPDLATIANTGHLAASDSVLAFAFLVRDELRAYDPSWRPRWTADRGMTWPVPPSLPPRGRERDVVYQPVNLSVAALGDAIYVLAYAGPAADSIRIDRFHATTGVVERTTTLPSGTWLVSTDDAGALWYAPADTLAVIGAPAVQRVVDFRLPTFAGDTLGLRSLRGKVVLLNFWASWCGPCRDEFPHMARLARELEGDDFAIVAASDDLSGPDARRFIAEFDPPFTTVWARGSLERDLAYRGLPFTMLLDRQGRVVKKYFGFGGPSQFERLRSDITALIAQRSR